MRLERRADIPWALAVAAPVGAIVAALALAAILIALAGVDPLAAYRQLVVSAFGSRLSLTETATRATPLILTGLAAAVAFRARIWNIGGEGQFYLGALAAAFLGAHGFGLPPALHIVLMMVAGAVAGLLLLLGPLALRLRFGVDEVVTTLLLNFVVLLVVSMMIEGPMKDPMAFGWPQSVPIERDFALAKLLPRSRLHVGLLVALALALLVWFLEAKSRVGLAGRAVGLNTAAARFAGLPVARVLLATACLSGGLAGLAGAIEVMGLKGYVTTDLSPGYGYSGIVVAMLAGLHPLGVVLAAFFVACVFVGADGMSRAMAIPSFIADVIVALSLLTMLVALLLTTYRVRR